MRDSWSEALVDFLVNLLWHLVIQLPLTYCLWFFHLALARWRFFCSFAFFSHSATVLFFFVGVDDVFIFPKLQVNMLCFVNYWLGFRVVFGTRPLQITLSDRCSYFGPLLRFWTVGHILDRCSDLKPLRSIDFSRNARCSFLVSLGKWFDAKYLHRSSSTHCICLLLSSVRYLKG